MKKLIGLVLGFSYVWCAQAASLPYDTMQDDHAELQHGLDQARNQHKEVLIIFGANWCEDCRALDRAMSGSSARLIGQRYIVVKIDVGNFDKNLELANHYGNPIRNGIPAAVVVAATDEVVYSTKAGELANARRMGERGIYDFFEKVPPGPRS